LTLDDLEKAIVRYSPNASLELVRRAYGFSARAHRGQTRVSGHEFIDHPLAVAFILAELELDPVTIAAALLHDVVEDTACSLQDVREEFGDEVTALVDGVTKLTQLEARTRLEEQAENLRKMLVAMARDIRVILIKLADRLHNMRTLGVLSRERRREIADETLEVFAPLAHRLGISRIQWELEDLALKYKHPETYEELREKVPARRQEREEYTRLLIDQLKESLEEVGIEGDIQGRAKHLYSIYRKIVGQDKEMAEIYDLVAVRVVVDTVKDCYGVLGTVHSLWKPIPGRFKDYIAMPKSNMYQSLHTTVIGPRGEPFEIQIRTWEMHRTAEYGIAAHWRYKESGASDEDFEKKLTWLREVLEWQSESCDAREFMESLKIDVFSDEVFVFTPKGDVIDLPAGSTPIDFAYRIHTEVGHRCTGAKVNGRIVPLDTKLQNGDIVEIITNKGSSGPSKDWLKIVQTSTARSRIRQWLKRERREENIERGEEMVRREIKHLGLSPQEVMIHQYMESVARRYNFSGPDDVLLAVGYGGLTAGQVAARLRDEYRNDHKPPEVELDIAALEETLPRRKEKDGPGVRVKGIDNILVRLARCCNPVPGDEILGYITRGRGVSIHRSDCPNLTHYLDEEDKDRVIEVSWEAVEAAYYPVELEISCIDRPGLLSAVAQVVADFDVNILAAKVNTKGNLGMIHLTLEIHDLEQLGYIGKRIERVRDVLAVERMSRR